MSIAFALAAALAVQAPPPGAGFMTFSASPARRPVTTEVQVGILRGAPRPEDRHYWFRAVRRDASRPERRLSTDTLACPAAHAVFRTLGEMEMPSLSPRPDDPIVVTADGTSYRMTAPAYWPHGFGGTVTLESNVDTGLARWVAAMLGALEPCWHDEAAPARR
jgi:hypothetical protein